jgi:predicted nucleotidyltransferase
MSVDIIGNIGYSKTMDINVPFIDKIVPLIVSLVSPDQIVLFGSYARGDNTEKSDIDLLIIKIDYTKYIELNNTIGYIYKTIKEQGKILYGTL